MRVMEQKAATEWAERHAATILRAAGFWPVPIDAGPMPYGPDEDLELLPDGGYQPYQVALAAGIGDVPPDQLEPALARVRDALQQAGWATNANGPTRLTGGNPEDGFAFDLEALHDLNRLVLSVTSPPYRHPA
jgi:hypothetical protein